MIDILIAAYLRYANRSAMQLAPLSADRALPPPDPARRYLLYVHVPFCPALCPFCSFHRVLLRDDKARRYFAALRTQLRQYAEAGFRVGSVYVGGGTPTAVPDELDHTLELIDGLFGRQSISVETNPSDLTPAVTGMLRARASTGCQSASRASTMVSCARWAATRSTAPPLRSAAAGAAGDTFPPSTST
jgi:coproporphyrinogen III oxidase-like Fe-S oxidoreductase